MQRVFVCANAHFPRGGAEANYIQYFALALMEMGYKVYVISRGKSNAGDWDEEKQRYCYKGIFYDNLSGSYDGIRSLIKSYFRDGQEVCRRLKEFKLDDHDHVIFYSVNYFYIKEIYRYVCKTGANAAMCITEWFQPFQYRLGLLNPCYWLEAIGFRYGIPMAKKVIPISTFLENYFKKRGCDTLCLPIMMDTSEYMYQERRGYDGKTRFIYSGKPFHKDDMEMMLRTFVELSEEEKKQVEFHLTGLGEKGIKQLEKKYGNSLFQLKDVLYIHEWMDYDELIKLYQKMDFLLIVRNENKVTLSNFPSKVPEMMNYGIIPVVSDVGDYTSLYLKDGEDSVIIKCHSLEACVSAIRRAMTMTKDERKRFGEKARETVKDHFDYRVWSQNIEVFMEGK